MTSTAEMPDDQLVAQSLDGNRDAFGRIVSRYQSLICSLAYSATGSLGQSDDLAQETFIMAWKHLRQLREKQKLRAWLCGIARNRINNSLRRDGREPLRDAKPLDSAPDSPAPEPLPHDQTISNEEQAILWRSLERIPEIYREPLVLFYREHQSIERVAQHLELTEDAVKQRLSRGRKLLHEQVIAFVESALERTNPGKAFTIAVLASLPVLATSAKAAATAGLFNAILGPVLGFVGPWIQYRIFLAVAKTDREREDIKSYYRKLLGLMLGFAVLLAALIIFGGKFVGTHPLLFASALISLVAAYVFAAIRMGIWANRMFRQLRTERAALEANNPAKPAWEYRSRVEWLGLPLIHIRLNQCGAKRSPVKAWIAVSDCAFGLLFAFGEVAVAPVSIGGLAIGLMSWGGAAVGLFAVGGFALGWWTFGGFAFGWEAFGGCAMAWHAALGGIAIARDFAFGGVGHAAQANNEITRQFINTNSFFQNMLILSRHIAWMNLLWLIPLIRWWRVLARKRAKMQSGQ
jgi:RNA polymerase sigma factor (sigma-70 family)